MNGTSISETVSGHDIALCFGAKEMTKEVLAGKTRPVFDLRPRAKDPEVNEELRLNRIVAFGRSFAESLY